MRQSYRRASALFAFSYLIEDAAGYIRMPDSRGRERVLFSAARGPRRLYEVDSEVLDVIVQWRDGTPPEAVSVNVSQLKAWRAAGLVESVEINSIVRATAPYAADAPVLAQIEPPSWGIDRIDQQFLPLDQRYHFRGDGSGVYVFVVDSGCKATHSQLVGRVLPG